jgi:hypothetical protein
VSSLASSSQMLWAWGRPKFYSHTHTLLISSVVTDVLKLWTAANFECVARDLYVSACYMWDCHVVPDNTMSVDSIKTAATTGLLYQPQMIVDCDCGAIGGMKICRGNRSTQRKPATAPFCLPQIPHNQTRAGTRASALGSQRLTAWVMTRAH